VSVEKHHAHTVYKSRAIPLILHADLTSPLIFYSRKIESGSESHQAA